jgi:hypothetical protein
LDTSKLLLSGSLLATWQLSDAFGIFLGFAANLAVLDLHASSNITWRVQTITVLIPTVALLFVVYLLPGNLPPTWGAEKMSKLTISRIATVPYEEGKVSIHS